MAQWVRAYDFIYHDHVVREVGGSNPGRGAIVEGRGVHPTRQLAKFSLPNMPYLVNSKFV